MKNEEKLIITITNILASIQRRLGLEGVENKLYSKYFRNLIEGTYAKY